MSEPYFQKNGWPNFAVDGSVYDLAHLNEDYISIQDSNKLTYKIAITYGDHCFTRAPKPGDDPALLYRASSRSLGHFCSDRYRHSLGLKNYLLQAVPGKVWHAGHDVFAIVPTVEHQGGKALYAIVFSLDPVTGLPVQLHMRIKTAYLCDQKPIATYGEVRFSHLASLRVRNKYPNRITDKGRKRPRIVG